MSSYAVIWASEGHEESPVAGSLQVTPQGVVLHGGSRSAEQRIEIRSDEIVCARRTDSRLGPLRAIALDSGHAGTILIASLAGASFRHEILEQLQRLVAAL